MGSKRTYNHFCPLAYSLDAIGDRWSLLLVRELSLGPRRFRDLQRGLAGIGPNLLARRLKELAEFDVVELVTLPPPAGVKAYQLTAAGRELLAALQPLAGWGMRFLPGKLGAGDYLSNVAAINALRAMAPARHDGEPTAVEIFLPPDLYHLRLSRDVSTAAQGPLPDAPLALQTDAPTLLALAGGALDVPTAVAAGQLAVTRGDAAGAARVFDRLQGKKASPTSYPNRS